MQLLIYLLQHTLLNPVSPNLGNNSEWSAIALGLEIAIYIVCLQKKKKNRIFTFRSPFQRRKATLRI